MLISRQGDQAVCLQAPAAFSQRIQLSQRRPQPAATSVGPSAPESSTLVFAPSAFRFPAS
ncbi:hypothetical protein CPCC7001_377 [Cyanobium sp. PCC 7001]|nr:hypothetical protein CPCC7001_377 [Cyanobium sp. PCC 7001]